MCLEKKSLKSILWVVYIGLQIQHWKPAWPQSVYSLYMHFSCALPWSQKGRTKAKENSSRWVPRLRKKLQSVNVEGPYVIYCGSQITLYNDFFFQPKLCLNHSISFCETFTHVLKASSEGTVIIYPTCWNRRFSRLSLSGYGFQPWDCVSFSIRLKRCQLWNVFCI